MKRWPLLVIGWFWFALGTIVNPAAVHGATNLFRYYGREAVLDDRGVIAPWYQGLNGQFDFRIRVAAETLKRYPWATRSNAIAAYPDYLFTSKWKIAPEGVITPQNPGDWMNGDLGQRSTSVLNAMVDYYQYSGDPAAIAHLTYMGDYLLDHALTPVDHPWPKFPISVPVKGKPYGDADPHGMIQLDICADMGHGLLRAYEVTGNQRWLEAAKGWGDLFAKNCNRDPKSDPWLRYANPEDVKWHTNKQTGGVTMILGFLDELVRVGYNGKNDDILKARAAGWRYLNEKLLPNWNANDTWAYYFWDWPNQTQNCSTTADAAAYLIANKRRFPNWRNDARNILTEFLIRSSANPASGGDVYSGAWAYPESSSCCGRSLWYPPLMVGTVMAQLGVEADNRWIRELARRQLILQTYDAVENGVTQDNIDGGVIVNGNWLNIAHPWPLRWLLKAIGWMPEELGANCENHVVHSSAVVRSVRYEAGEIEYETFDAPPETVDVLRLSFIPDEITADGRRLKRREDLHRNGYVIKALSNGDAIVQIRHDGVRKITVIGKDSQRTIQATQMERAGKWEPDSEGQTLFARGKGASASATFYGNQIRLIGRADRFGGEAQVYLDGERQMVPIDCWNPTRRDKQVLFYKNGLENRQHTLKIVALGLRNPYSEGEHVYVSEVHYSGETQTANLTSVRGPSEPQRMIFGYTGRKDYKDSKGFLWRPGLEVVAHVGAKQDSLAVCSWTNTNQTVGGTKNPELYRYGIHGRNFWINLTVDPGEYDLRLAFANTRDLDTRTNSFELLINGKTVAEKFDVNAAAGGTSKAVDLVYKNIKPRNGVIEVRFKGGSQSVDGKMQRGDAFVQALELTAAR